MKNFVLGFLLVMNTSVFAADPEYAHHPAPTEPVYVSAELYPSFKEKLPAPPEPSGKLQNEDEKELFKYKQMAEDSGLKTALIKDAGHTVVEPGTITCLGIGPDEEEKIDRVTGKLRMM